MNVMIGNSGRIVVERGCWVLVAVLLAVTCGPPTSWAQSPNSNDNANSSKPRRVIRTPKSNRRPAPNPQPESQPLEDGSADQGSALPPNPAPVNPDAAVADPQPPADQPQGVEIPPEIQRKIDEMMRQDPSAQSRSPTTPGRKTPEQLAAEREERRRKIQERQAATPHSPSTAPSGAVPVPGAPAGHVDIPPGDQSIAPEHRRYSFSIKDATYDVLMEGVARQTGLAVMGDVPPDGKVSFVTEEELSFDELLKRVRMLLFRYKPLEPYWLLREPTHLEVIRITDYQQRGMPRDRMYPDLESYRRANLDSDELALVVYTPPNGSLTELNQVRDYMPDYVRVAPLDNRNAVAISALVSDIEKYFWLINFFGTGDLDLRKLERIPVKYITPTEAHEKLQSLMSLGPGGAVIQRPTPRGGRAQTADPIIGISEPDVTVLPDDLMGVLIVKAMPNKIEEMKRLLSVIDVGTDTPYAPVVIQVRHTDPQLLITTIQQIMGLVDSGTASPTPVSSRRRPRGAVPAPTAGAAPVSSDLMLMVHPSAPAIIAMGPVTEVGKVQEYVRVFDVKGSIGPVRISLSFTDAESAVSMLTQVLQGAIPGASPRGGAIPAGGGGSQVVTDPSGSAIWFTGTQQDLDRVHLILADLDVAPEPTSLHVVQLQNQKPSFVAGILTQYDTGVVTTTTTGPGARSKRSGRRGVQIPAGGGPGAAGTASKFNPDDEQGRLYIICTDSEWETYRAVIQNLEESTGVFDMVLIAVEHMAPDDAVGKLSGLMGTGGPGKDAAKFRMETTDSGILVLGATPSEITQMRQILAEFDRPVVLEERTFEIIHADPTEIKTAVEALLVDGTGSVMGGGAVRRPRRGPAGVSPAAGGTATGGNLSGLTIVQVDRRLIVKAAPAIMVQVTDYIAQLDVKSDKRSIMVYEKCPPSADIEAIANQISGIMLGSATSGRGLKIPAGGTPESGAQFIPQTSTGKLIVIAEKAKMPEIEELLVLLCREVEREPAVVAYIPVKYVNPVEAVENIEPFLALQVRDLIRTGEVVETMPEESTAVPKPRGVPRPVTSGAAPKPYHLAADERNQRVVIAASEKIIELARQLILDYDTPRDQKKVFVRSIEVTHAEPSDLVELIDPLLAMKVQQIISEGGLAEEVETAPVNAKLPPRMQMRGTSTASKSYHLIADDEHHCVVIAATEAVIEEAKQLVAQFDLPAAPGAIVLVEFLPVRHADPAELIETLDPLLDMKVNELVRSGEIPEPVAQAPAQQPVNIRQRVSTAGGKGTKRYHLEADVRGRRIVIAAPQSVIDEARKLVESMDIPAIQDESTFVSVMLKNAAPEEIVRAVKELMGTPVRPAAVRGKSAPAPTIESSGAPFSIVEAPGGGSVVLEGHADQVRKARSWIEQLDAMAVSGRLVKVYEVHHAKIETLVDVIMSVVDTSGRSTPKRPTSAPKSLSKSDMGEEEEEEDIFVTSITRAGTDVYIKADLIANTMIVVATHSKISEIDKLVAQFDVDESPVGEPAPVPRFLYELKWAEAFTAADDLEAILKVMWDTPNERPRVNTGPIGETLVITYPHANRFDEIRELIANLVDKPNPTKLRVKRTTFNPPAGMSPRDFLLLLQMNNPDLDFEMVDQTPESKTPLGIERVRPQTAARINPCVLPLSLGQSAALTVLTSTSTTQSPDDPPEEEPIAEETSESEEEPAEQPAKSPPDKSTPDELIEAARAAIRDTTSPTPGKSKEADVSEEEKKRKSYQGDRVRVYFDNEKGTVTIEGASDVVEDVPDWVDEIKEQFKDAEFPPDIRIYRVRYIDVYTAQDIIEELFNVSRQQLQNIQMQQQQVIRQQQFQQRQAQQQARQAQQQGVKGGEDPAEQARLAQQQQQAAMQIPELPKTSVRVYPNPRDRTLILRADTNQYPAIEELLATIDQPKPIDSIHRIIPLRKLNALDVEELLRDWLGLTDSEAASLGRRGGGGPEGSSFPNSGPGSQLPQTIIQETKTGIVTLGVDPQDIKLSSNAVNNTILVMAPQAALDYIEDIILDLENQDVSQRTWRTYQLKFADAEEVAEYLTTRLSAGRTGRGRASRGSTTTPSPELAAGVNTPTIVPYPRLRQVAVQATEEQFAEVEEVLKEIDVASGAEEFQSVTLVHADAGVVAGTLEAMFAGPPVTGRPRGRDSAGSAVGASNVGPRFVGEEGGNVLFFSAPERLHERIRSVIAELEEQSAAGARLHVVTLEQARPSDVAAALEEAYGGRSSRRGGRSTSAPASSPVTFSVTAHDASRRLFVMADDNLYREMEPFIKALDVSSAFPAEFKVYALKYADAHRVHETMGKLITDYQRRLPPHTPMEPFSVEVDTQTNSLVVLGGPLVFAFVEDALKTVDTPQNAASPPSVLMVPLTTASASEVAASINKLWSVKTREGEEPPQADFSPSLNTIIVRGTREQLEEIRREFIDPLEKQVTAQMKSETISLEHALAEDVADVISRVYDDRRKIQQQGSGVRGPAPAPLDLAVAITADPTANQLIVQANDVNLAFIRERVAQLDRPELAGGSLASTQVYPLQYGDPNSVVSMIREWSKSQPQPTGGPARRTAPRDLIIAVADTATQSVVVTASESNHVRVKEMIDGLEKDGGAAQKLLKTIRLKYADAWSIQEAIGKMFKPDGRNQKEQVTAVAEPAANAVVVSASSENLRRIDELITALDTPEAVQKNVHVLTLENAAAESVARTLDDVFIKSGSRPQGGQAPPISVSALQGSKAVVIRCKSEDFSEIEAIVKSLDNEQSVAGQSIRVVPLLFTDATEVQTSLQTYLAKSASSGTGPKSGGELIGDLRVSVLSQTNSVVISGSEEKVKRVEQIVHDLDAAGEKGSVPQIIALKNARVGQIFASVQEMFQDRPRGGGGRQTATPPVIVANEAINALVVRGSPTDVAAIESVVARLDTEEVGKTQSIKIVQVSPGIGVVDLGEKVETTVNEAAAARMGGSGGRGIEIPRIIVTPDPRTNSLIIAGSPTLFTEAEEIVRKLEELGPPGNVVTTVFNVPNVPVEDIQRLIDQLTNPAPEERRPSRTQNRPSRTPARSRPPVPSSR